MIAWIALGRLSTSGGLAVLYGLSFDRRGRAEGESVTCQGCHGRPVSADRQLDTRAFAILCKAWAGAMLLMLLRNGI